MGTTLRPARLSSTIIYAGEAYHPVSQDYIHVLTYQNKAENKDTRPNALVLPIPTDFLGPENSIDMAGHRTLLKDMAKPLLAMNTERDLKRGSRAPEPFKMGSYTTVIAGSDNIAEALSRLPDSLRPQLNREIFRSFAEWYPGWQIAICCWDGKIEPEPLLWWYRPLNPKTLFYPTLGAHNGKAPDLQRDILRDHLLLVGSKVHPVGIPTKVSDFGLAAPYLSDRIWGRVLKEEDFNRDYTLSVSELRDIKNTQGVYDMHSRLDPKIWDLSFEHLYPGRGYTPC